MHGDHYLLLLFFLLSRRTVVDHEESSASRADIRVTRWCTSPLSWPVSHVNLQREPRKEETRDRNKRGEELARGAYEENRKGCCGLECPLLGRPSTLRSVGVPPPSASMYLFFSLPSVYLSLFRLFDEALHLRHRCISELLLCLLSSRPHSAIYGSSEVTFLIIIPTGRSLTRTQPSSCALVTYGSRVTNPRAAWSMISHSKEPIANRTS